MQLSGPSCSRPSASRAGTAASDAVPGEDRSYERTMTDEESRLAVLLAFSGPGGDSLRALVWAWVGLTPATRVQVLEAAGVRERGASWGPSTELRPPPILPER